MPFNLLKLATLPLLFVVNSDLVFASSTKHQDAEMAALLAMLKSETELATHSKMNADYVPGMVSILHGDDLRSYGVTTVAEALDQIAGFYLTVNNAGEPVAIVRGIGASLEANNLKVLVDGVAANRAVDASSDWAFRLPVSQVDRIEVIRGPGSALYGEFAFAGVVNIIPRKDNFVALSGGSHEFVQGDVGVAHTFSSGATLSFSTVSWARNDSARKTNPDNFAGRGNGHSPGEIYDHEQGTALFVDGSYQGYRVKFQYADVERGGWYGRNAALPQDLEPREETVTGVQLSKEWRLSSSLNASLLLGAQQTELKHATYLPIPGDVRRRRGPPPGDMAPPPRPPRADRFRQDGNEDSSKRARFNLHWEGLEHHQWFFEVGYARSEVKSSSILNYSLGSPRQYGTPDQTLVLEGSERTLISVTVQDQWQLLENMEITLGARYDDYDDWGSNLSPRIAAVWRASERHLFKAQYAEAFRPPTLADQNPGPNTVPGLVYTPLNEEQLDSAELSYILKDANYQLRGTLFHTNVNDLIEFYLNPGDPPIWRNRPGELKSTGVELEWQQQVGRAWQWQTSISYVDARDSLDLDSEPVGAVEWMANLGLSWRQSSNLHHAVWVRYRGEQEGWDLAPRNPNQTFEEFTTANYTLTVNEALGISRLGVKASIHNIADHHYSTVPNPAQYPLGLPQAERTAWIQISYDI